MSVEIVDRQSDTATLQITVDLQGTLLEAEQKIQDAINEIGGEATRLAIEQFDTDGSPIQTGGIKWTRRCRSQSSIKHPMVR